MAVRRKGVDCAVCSKRIVLKDEIGINRKLLGEDTTEFYCLEDFSEYLGCSVDDLIEKIKEFKEAGCKLFE